MADAGWMILAIEGDRERRPRNEFWGDWLYRVDVPKCSLTLPFGDVRSVYNVDRFGLRRKLLLPSSVRLPGLFVIVLALCIEPLVFGIKSIGLFEDPTVSVGMVSRLTGSTVYLTYPVQDFV